MSIYRRLLEEMACEHDDAGAQSRYAAEIITAFGIGASARFLACLAGLPLDPNEDTGRQAKIRRNNQIIARYDGFEGISGEHFSAISLSAPHFLLLPDRKDRGLEWVLGFCLDGVDIYGAVWGRIRGQRDLRERASYEDVACMVVCYLCVQMTSVAQRHPLGLTFWEETDQLFGDAFAALAKRSA